MVSLISGGFLFAIWDGITSVETYVEGVDKVDAGSFYFDGHLVAIASG